MAEDETPEDVKNLPYWVPLAVAKVARHLDGLNNRRRLLCDPRMEGVWRELRKKEPHEVASKLEPPERSVMKLEGLLSEGVPAADQACAAFIISVARKFWHPSVMHVWTIPELEKKATRLEVAAEECRWFLTEPEMYPEAQLAAKQMADLLQTNADSLRERHCLANLDQQQIKPFVLDRSSHSPGYRGGGGNNQDRAYTRAIAADARQIFGSFFYRRVATVVSVALQKKVSQKNVENWCVNL
jgi:hypothetical protein